MIKILKFISEYIKYEKVNVYYNKLFDVEKVLEMNIDYIIP
jgi:hypothetical protein